MPPLLELGSLAEQEHETVGRRAALVAGRVVTFGDLATMIARAATLTSPGSSRRAAVVSFPAEQRAELVAFLQTELRQGDVALIKGSRALRMEEVVDAVAARG
jgi:UDP-N-acetylmuramoyl-tripeptide--D-alanyl-D-alanine ligase